MKRAMRILSLVSLTSVYVMGGSCVMSGDGWSFLPTITLSSLPFIGTFFK